MKILTTKAQLRYTLESGRRIIFEPGATMGTPPPAGPVTWDSSTAVQVSLSNGNLTLATQGYVQCAMTTDTKSSGKYYFEITLNSIDSTSNYLQSWGLSNPTRSFTDLTSDGGVGGITCYRFVGSVQADAAHVSPGFIATRTGDVIGIAADLDYKKIWLKCVAGPDINANWNGETGEDPATNTGGNAFTASPVSPFVAFGSPTDTDQMTANFGGSAFVGTVPSGFTSGWPLAGGGFTSFSSSASYKVALTNSNLTATNQGSWSDGQGVFVAAASAKTTGKYYYEMTVTTIDQNDEEWGQSGFGVALPTATFLNLYTNATGGVICQNGNTYSNGSNLGNYIGAFAQGDVIGVAVDLTNRQIWFKPVAGSQLGTDWNGFTGADPASNTGGISVLSGSIVPVGVFGFADTFDAMTANFGASSFVGTVPTGFTNGWPA